MAYDWIQVSSPLAYSASSATVLQGLRGSELTNSKGVVPVMYPSHNSLLSLLCTLQVLLNGWKLLELWVACWSSDKLHYHILHKHGFVCQWWCSTLNRFGYQKFNREDYKDIRCSLCLQFVFFVECEDIYLGSPMMLSMLAYIMDIMARHAAMWFTGFNGVPNIILHSHLWFFDAEIYDCGNNGSFQKWKLPLSSFEFVCLESILPCTYRSQWLQITLSQMAGILWCNFLQITFIGKVKGYCGIKSTITPTNTCAHQRMPGIVRWYAASNQFKLLWPLNSSFMCSYGDTIQSSQMKGRKKYS